MITVAHAGFTLTRDYPVPIAELWAAFAVEERKRAWFGGGDEWTPGEWRFDFRVGGLDVDEARFHDGVLSRYEARYTDIVELTRIVTSYDMWIDGRHISTSVASFEFEDLGDQARLTHTEHGVHLDGLDDGASREHGSRLLLDALGRTLSS
ncbi:SRPBCC domain-containing protein [Georgenia sp. TF02-10]|uniref:SRPBCC domain-containing protein n=1 Tax=Georgenia sp. TF02-10 TaxID=2917725 RepID=UPI001FA703EA|nr:SRPBCC domain-containing protein [Georgenia sp. TF02-10]UNX54758.1 SRPBCC domain-containing protein [Georgenia sp. TF02-10]